SHHHVEYTLPEIAQQISAFSINPCDEKAEQQRKENQAEHLPFGGGRNDIDRNQIEEHTNQIGCAPTLDLVEHRTQLCWICTQIQLLTGSMTIDKSRLRQINQQQAQQNRQQ